MRTGVLVLAVVGALTGCAGERWSPLTAVNPQLAWMHSSVPDCTPPNQAIWVGTNRYACGSPAQVQAMMESANAATQRQQEQASLEDEQARKIAAEQQQSSYRNPYETLEALRAKCPACANGVDLKEWELENNIPEVPFPYYGMPGSSTFRPLQ